MHRKASRSLARNLLLSAMVCTGTVLVNTRENTTGKNSPSHADGHRHGETSGPDTPSCQIGVLSVADGCIMMYTLSPGKVAGVSCD